MPKTVKTDEDASRDLIELNDSNIIYMNILDPSLNVVLEYTSAEENILQIIDKIKLYIICMNEIEFY